MSKAVDYDAEPGLRPHREGPRWKVAEPGFWCRQQGLGHRSCGRPAVMALDRGRFSRLGGRSENWWYYCELHGYGRVVRDGEVWWDPNAAAAIRPGAGLRV